MMAAAAGCGSRQQHTWSGLTRRFWRSFIRIPELLCANSAAAVVVVVVVVVIVVVADSHLYHAADSQIEKLYQENIYL